MAFNYNNIEKKARYYTNNELILELSDIEFIQALDIKVALEDSRSEGFKEGLAASKDKVYQD